MAETCWGASVRLHVDYLKPQLLLGEHGIDHTIVVFGSTRVALLASRGWVEGKDLFYYAFPDAHHDEHSWAMRCHIPIQVFFGRRPGPGRGSKSESEAI